MGYSSDTIMIENPNIPIVLTKMRILTKWKVFLEISIVARLILSAFIGLVCVSETISYNANTAFWRISGLAGLLPI